MVSSRCVCMCACVNVCDHFQLLASPLLFFTMKTHAWRITKHKTDKVATYHRSQKELRTIGLGSICCQIAGRPQSRCHLTLLGSKHVHSAETCLSWRSEGADSSRFKRRKESRVLPLIPKLVFYSPAHISTLQFFIKHVSSPGHPAIFRANAFHAWSPSVFLQMLGS